MSHAPHPTPIGPAAVTGAKDRAVAVIGAGPRGIAVLERLVAASRTQEWSGTLTVHLVDRHVGRGGAVWRTDQSPVLLMNTATCQTTMYPDASCAPRLPVPHGETLADALAGEGYAPADIAPRREHGRYLVRVLERAEADADPARLRIVRHAQDAIDVTGPPDGPQTVHLASGGSIEVDAAALALGHLATALTPRSRRVADVARRFGLVHLPSANPLEVDHAALLGRERVAVQGMGLNFYDLIGMLTEAAGGRFEECPAAPSGLRYLPGGPEPQLVVGSRSGMVYRPKPDLRPELPAPYAPRVLDDAAVSRLIARDGGLDHERDTLPLMVAELEAAFAESGFDALAEEGAIMRLLFPLGRKAVAVPDAHRRTRAVLREALAAAADPDPAWVLAFRVLTALRIQVNRLADVGAFTPGSYTRDVDGFLRNAFASWASGPPVMRVRQVLALEEAGLLVFTGPGFDLGLDEAAGRFTVHAGEGPRHLCDAMIEAHLPSVDLERYTSPLITAWRRRREVRPAPLSALHGDAGVPTGSIDVADRLAPIAEDGTVHERRLLLGVPVSAAQPGSAITAAPGTSPQLLRTAEEVAIRLARLTGSLVDGPRETVELPEAASLQEFATWGDPGPGETDGEPDAPRTDEVADEDVPWAMQIVVLRDKQHLAADLDVAAAAARAVVSLLDDERAAPGGPWHEPVTRWATGGRIRKLVRRADGKRWEDVQELPGVTVAIPGEDAAEGPAAARAIVPGPTRPLPRTLDKLQVGGTAFVRREEHGHEHPDTEAAVSIEVSPHVEITSGKLVAQVAHAAQRAHDLAPDHVRERWRRDGFRVAIRRPSPAEWDAASRPVSITDAGFTELDGPTETTRASW